jgi:CBS domain-containing protein
MEKLGADPLPVVGPDGRFVGIIDRSRLTTRVLLEIAAERG